MHLINNKPFLNLDKYLNINHFLSLKKDFCLLSAQNIDKEVSSWASGGIDADTAVERFKKPTTLYQAYHNTKQIDDPVMQEHISLLENKDSYYERGEGLARYLQLMAKGYCAFKLLRLKTGAQPSAWQDFVTNDTIKEWVDTLPFSEVTNVDMFFKDNHVVPYIHKDHNLFPVEEGDDRATPGKVQELIYFRWHVGKGFCVYDIDADGNIIEEIPLDGHAIFFNHYNWHGKLGHSISASLVLKIEGVFTDEFRKLINE